MKTKTKRAPSEHFQKLAYATIALFTSLSPVAADTLALQLEESTDMVHWTPLSLRDVPISGTGKALRSIEGQSHFYRMTALRTGDPAAGNNPIAVQALPLAEAPAEARKIAESRLASSAGVLAEGETPDDAPTWGTDSQLGPICYPIYDLAVNGGLTPAYMEFKVVPTTPERPAPGLSGPVEDDNPNRGYIHVSLHHGDSPVTGSAESGETQVETLLRRASLARVPVAKVLRFDSQCLVAADAAGQPIASLGSFPRKIAPSLLEVAGQEFGTMVSPTGGLVSESTPDFPDLTWASWEEFKSNYQFGETHMQLRAKRSEATAMEWALEGLAEPREIQVGIGQTLNVAFAEDLDSVISNRPDLCRPSLDGGGGVDVLGVALGQAVLTVLLESGETRYILVDCIAAGAAPRTPRGHGGWRAWVYSYASTFNEQRRYSQIKNHPQLCSGTWSGCGPTAWAMLYGYWDTKGRVKCFGNTSLADAPLYNNQDLPSMVSLLSYIHPRMSVICAETFDQAATLPTSMKHGLDWASHRGFSVSGETKWGLPYVSPGATNLAFASINANRPSIVGVGFYSHYPLAYGYRYREYKGHFGTVWAVQWDYKTTSGHGSSDARWYDGKATWYATNVVPQN